MAQSTALRDAAVDRQVVRAFLERSCTIENAIKVLQQDKSALHEECKGRGLAMKTMTAAIALAKKRQLVPVSRDTLDALISEGEEKLPAPEDSRWTGGGQPEDCCVCTEGSAHGLLDALSCLRCLGGRQRRGGQPGSTPCARHACAPHACVAPNVGMFLPRAQGKRMLHSIGRCNGQLSTSSCAPPRWGAAVRRCWAKCLTMRPDCPPPDHRSSTCASAASVSGSQKVISMARYSSIAVDSSVRACSRWPVVAYSVPRPRWQWAWSGRMPSSSARARAWR